MIDNHPESQPSDDGHNPESQSHFAQDEFFANAQFDLQISASRIVNRIEQLCDKPEQLDEFIAAELARIEQLATPAEVKNERETLLYAFEWVFTNMAEAYTVSAERMLAVSEQAALVFERFSDQPLLGADRQCEKFEHALVKMIDSLFDEVRAQDELSYRFCSMLGCVGRGFGAENALGRASVSPDGVPLFTEGYSEIYDRMQADLIDLAASRMEDVPNFEVLRVFPDAYSLHEIKMMTAVISLVGDARLHELREHCHFLFVRVYNWYQRNVPEVGVFGGGMLPEPELVSNADEYRDSEGDDRDAPWRESLKSDDELEGKGTEDEATETEPEQEDYFSASGARRVPPDMSTVEQRTVAMDELLLSLLTSFSSTLSPHVAEPVSAAVRANLLTLIEDMSPEWFAWPAMLSVYASISAECMEQARIPLEVKLLRPMLQGNSQLADGLVQFIEGGRDQLELCAAVMRGYSRPERAHIIEAIREAGCEVEFTVFSDSGEPDMVINPTLDRLEKALTRSGHYVELPD